MQIVHLGRAADPSILERKNCPSNPGGPYHVSAPSATRFPEWPEHIPKELSEGDISAIISDFRQAAQNAVHRAGFDGVEIHGAHGYLVDSFLQEMTNERKDGWGGSIEKRARFPLMVVKAIVEEVGEERTAIRLSPFSTFNGTKRTSDSRRTWLTCHIGMHMKDPQPTFAYFVSELREMHPRLAYLHVTEPRVAAHDDREAVHGESNDFLRKIWKTKESQANGSMYISAGGYTLQRALEDAEKKGDLIAFGRYFTSNVRSYYILQLSDL